jgi:hypothetical protein
MQAFGLMIINYSSTSIKAVNTRSFAYHNRNKAVILVVYTVPWKESKED